MLALIKILAAFAAMLGGIRFKLGLGWSILGGSLVLALLFGKGLGYWFGAALDGVLYAKTIYLAGIVCGIMYLSMIMERTGQAERLMNALSGFLRRPRLAVMFFPALIGLLPMPGGAVFSAPMVKRFASPLTLSPEQMSAVNYWFRHVWELCWPLYPGVILCASLAEVPILEVCLYLLFTPVLALALGWKFLLPKQLLKSNGNNGAFAGPQGAALDAATPQVTRPQQGDGKAALREGRPIIIAIVGGLALEGLISLIDIGLDYEWGVLAALAWAARDSLKANNVPWAEAKQWLFSRKLGNMLMVVAAIFIFKESLAGTGAITQMAQTAGSGAALFATAWLLPFLVGAIAGINVAFVGAVFPLLLALFETLGITGDTMAYLSLGMISGMSGVLISPIHLCFILTCEYFHADAVRTWRLLLWPCLLLLASGVLYFAILLML